MIPLLEVYKERWQVESEQAIKPGLEAIEFALRKLGEPQKQLNVVHLAGTNGKGSTLAFIEGMAREYGLSVGKFMSPCIVDVHDQIQIDGRPITNDQMDRMFQQLAKAGLSGKLTDFELLTAVALLYFAEQSPDLVLIEAGMGGREDSTNVVTPIVSVVPSIALEHTNFLGNTLTSIAYHKAGILKENRPAVIGDMTEEVAEVFEKEAMQKNVQLSKFGKDFFVTKLDGTETYEYPLQQITISDLQRQLLGKHQGHNMVLAITAFLVVIKKFELLLDLQKIRKGVNNATLAGRFEQIRPNLYFDGAHNPASIQSLVDTVKEHFPNKRIEFIIGLLADKDIKTILQLLEEVGDAFYFANIHNKRAMQAMTLYELSQAKEKQIIDDVNEFLQGLVKGDTVRIVTGSLYLLSEIRRNMH
ncbi:dihydrofolate synthase/folylpolyglutamate synthase [Solibacillus kalamii]|uniref:tetrahydrofolate synthase n=1 Tax=Solibacillus kalamii TaxID=1748298 RepID=A0ABX3ZJ85_9BACL|nr:folylpolyglutamate synthase/dihydrofolate synthase family protein [Solibacillus kalamii]MBM7664435.1 dihydrofolate synthase/folylpolyglutamate synthase [Solibacillus kalamii]OUZ39809.1 bifunctional folylpolyglutamate synthase/dihydrofolate synthase [Solibacillus kalamii]